MGFAPGCELVGLWYHHWTASPGWRNILSQLQYPRKRSGATGQRSCPSLGQWHFWGGITSTTDCVPGPVGNSPKQPLLLFLLPTQGLGANLQHRQEIKSWPCW